MNLRKIASSAKFSSALGICAAISVAAITVTATRCKNSASKSARSETLQDSAQTAKNKNSVYYCPMHPQVKNNSPGTCPICGMSLVQRQDISEEHVLAETPSHLPEGHAPIRLSEKRLQMIGVKLGTVLKQPLFKTIEAAGRVAFDPELYTAQNEYMESLRQLSRIQDSPLPDVRRSASQMVESAKLRLKILGLSDRQINLMSTSKNSGSNLLIPKPGENIWIYAEIFEMDLASVHPGLDAEITGSVLEGKTLTGKVVSLDRVINSVTRTAKVRISVSEGMTHLRPESYVDVSIRSPLGTQVAVPFDAVLDTGKESWVFTAEKTGELTPRRVTIKFRAGDRLAIATGLEGGEQIVTSANFLIDSESRLKAALIAESNSPTPVCPTGEEWHEQMGHCMKKTGPSDD